MVKRKWKPCICKCCKSQDFLLWVFLFLLYFIPCTTAVEHFSWRQPGNHSNCGLLIGEILRLLFQGHFFICFLILVVKPTVRIFKIFSVFCGFMLKTEGLLNFSVFSLEAIVWGLLGLLGTETGQFLDISELYELSKF